jgi:hypothetical protein
LELERAAAGFAINPKVSPFTGMVLATVAPVHIAEPSANCRAALMTLPLTTNLAQLFFDHVESGSHAGGLAQEDIP